MCIKNEKRAKALFLLYKHGDASGNTLGNTHKGVFGGV